MKKLKMMLILLPVLFSGLFAFQNCSGDSAFVALPEQASDQSSIAPGNNSSGNSSSNSGNNNNSGNGPGTTNNSDPTGSTTTVVNGVTIVTDAYVQQANVINQADILWVVDDSGSMENIQTNLANSFESFIVSFLNKNIDFQMRIITTDDANTLAGNKGEPIVVPRFYPRSGIDCSQDLIKAAADADSQKFIDDFKKCVKVGTDGNGYEKGIRTSRRFVEKHHSWFRPLAQKIFIYVSDEEDTSSGSVQSHYNTITSYENVQASQFTAYSITCTVPTSNSVCHQNQVGSRYMTMSMLSDGTSADMNQTPNFFTILSDLSTQIIELFNGFQLSDKPIASTIEVRVNNEVVPASHYEFRSTSNKVYFFEQHLPAVGLQIKISYEKE